MMGKDLSLTKVTASMVRQGCGNCNNWDESKKKDGTGICPVKGKLTVWMDGDGCEPYERLTNG